MIGLEGLAAMLALGILIKRPSGGSTTAAGGPQAWRNGQPVSVELVAIDGLGHLLERSAAVDFVRMRDQAQLDGVQLVVDSAFRTNEEQAALYAEYQSGQRTDVVAPPGYSNHQDGAAVDVATARGTNAAYSWLVANAATFNFVRTVPTEPWHWEHQS